MYRYLLDNEVKTEVILSIDDDMIIAESEVIKLYEKWYTSQDTFLIGPIHRYFDHVASKYGGNSKKYNLILPGLAITSKLHCLSVYDSQWKNLFGLALKFQNVDDLFFNIIFLLLSNQKPLYHNIRYNEIKNSSPEVSSHSCHMVKRMLFLSTVKVIYPNFEYQDIII